MARISTLKPHLRKTPFSFTCVLCSMAGKMAADAASMLGEAALNGVFQGLAQALTPVIQEKLGRLWGVDEELERLKKYLLGVQPLLNDAETRQFTEESVRSWVADLRGLTYDMEDILDETNYELLRSELENRDKSDGEQVPTLFSSLKLQVFSAVENYSFNDQIKKVLEKWEEIVEYGNVLRLREGIGGSTLGKLRKKRETTSFVDKNRVYGRESDKEKIISFLKTDESSARGNLSVIGIVGMGGIGKTTLAKLAYNDSHQFDIKAWVHVSHDFDRVRVIRCIIEAITKVKYELDSLNLMQCRLQELLKEKKLLLVLDDAWTPGDWEALLEPLDRSVQKRSKIIVTTRSEAVCKSMGSRDCIYKLKALSNDDCWTILKEKVLCYSDNSVVQVNLEKLRVNVVKKCQGLPLAVNVVGGLLGTIDVDKWERLLESEIWKLPKTKDDILSVLMLSFLCLDPYIKRCFTYTATCFKENSFRKVVMVRLWMAEGFIEVNKSDKMEDIANDYFDNLVARHFFQCLYYDDEDSDYVMHDLICELAQVIMGNISIRIQKEIGIEMLTVETRHVSMDYDTRLIFDKLVKAKSLRSLSILFYACNEEVFKQMIQCFKCLRVLELCHGKILEIPESIGNLKHLRHLNLHGCTINRLPDSICTLYNLQTLNLEGCWGLYELPGGIESLINLQSLSLGLTNLHMLPDSLGKLVKLQRICLAGCRFLRVLPTNIGDLSNLRSFDIQGTNVQKLPDSICRLDSLQTLRLWGCDGLTELPNDMSNLINLHSFDMKEELIKTFLLPNIERFTNIRRLSNYCITNESGIGRLNPLINLHKIQITNLENVESVEEGRVANLKNKHRLVRLEMKWSGPHSSKLRDGNVETEILEVLEPPHANLRELIVVNYGGFKFPSWLGDPSFSKLVEIELIGCSKCKLLTSLGQLCSLKKLVIEEMQELKHVGREFFGNGTFPSLLQFKLKHLPNLEGWSEAKEGDFPCLIKLEVKNCPKLRGLPITPFTLETLRVYGYEKTQECENLSGQNSEVGHCNEITMLMSLNNLTSLSSLTISGFRRVKLLPNGFLQSLMNINYLKIENCDELLNLPEGPSTTHSELCIINCPNMMSFGKRFQNITCLEILSIIGCPPLESSPRKLTLDSCLRSLKVVGYSNTTLSSVLPHLSALEHLKIKGIVELQNLPHDLLLNLTTLKSLEIEDCGELTSLLAELPSSLVKLAIIRCTASLLDPLPSSLQKLQIENCPNLASLPDELPSSLDYFYIDSCPNLASLPDELPSSLNYFCICFCEKIKSIPKAPCNLTILGINHCPLVESFPDNGLPTGLATLSIWGCPILIQRCQDRGSKEWSMIKSIENVEPL